MHTSSLQQSVTARQILWLIIIANRSLSFSLWWGVVLSPQWRNRPWCAIGQTVISHLPHYHPSLSLSVSVCVDHLGFYCKPQKVAQTKPPLKHCMGKVLHLYFMVEPRKLSLLHTIYIYPAVIGRRSIKAAV